LQATAIGANSQTAQSILKSDYSPELSLRDAKKLALTALRKIMDVTTLSGDCTELLQVTENDGSISVKRLTGADIAELIET